MKELKIFLASSIVEFRDFRNEIGVFFRRIQDAVIDEQIRVHLFVCEYYDKSITTKESKQDDYTEELRSSDIFIMLIGKKLGRYTKGEYDDANAINRIQKELLFLENTEDSSVVDFKNSISNNSNTNIYFPKTKDDIKRIILESISNKLEGINLYLTNGKIIIKKYKKG